MQIEDVFTLGLALQKSLDELKAVNTAELSTETYLKFIDIVGSIRGLHKGCVSEFSDIDNILSVDLIPEARREATLPIPTSPKHVLIDGELFYRDSKGGLHPESQTNPYT